MFFVCFFNTFLFSIYQKQKLVQSKDESGEIKKKFDNLQLEIQQQEKKHSEDLQLFKDSFETVRKESREEIQKMLENQAKNQKIEEKEKERIKEEESKVNGFNLSLFSK